jgi:DMSO reductase family type II enzyme molybdopterin subunit
MTVPPGEPNHLERYRRRTDADAVGWGSHCVDCYPANCTYRVYTKDGRIVREEIAGPIDPPPPGDLPDDLPLGCNKGAAWSRQLDAGDRVTYPMRRVGERGSGTWERVSWDDALDQIADALIDALETTGSASILREGSPEVGTGMGADRFLALLGGTTTDLNGSINDYAAGLQMTFGKPNQLIRPLDIFHADTILLWHINPAYTLIPVFHYLVEARYRGARVVLISPDVSPSHSHVDQHVPVEWGSDPALALSLCHVIVTEGLVDEDFVRTQTDLSLLVRSDTGRFLRQSDLEAGGRDDQFFHLVEDSSIEGGSVVPASRGDLRTSAHASLDGAATVTLLDGTEVEAHPLMVRLRAHLQDYEPDAVAAAVGTHPDVIRDLARTVAGGRTMVAIGGSASKTFHADLFQRATHLLLALTGNWGRKGSGTGWWNVTHGDGMLLGAAKPSAGPEGTEAILSLLEGAEQMLQSADPTMSAEVASFELFRSGLGGRSMVPPFFFWYWHCGFRARWNNQTWGDPTMARTFDDYVEEAMTSGWWDGLQRPGPETPPRVLIECGGNMLRRTRGGGDLLLEHLWPQLDLIVSIDFRFSVTAMHSDLVLPAAQHYEKVATHMPSMELVLGDQIVAPAGEARAEWEIFVALSEAVARRAEARGLTHYTTYDGLVHAYRDLPTSFTFGGVLRTTEAVVDEQVRDAAYLGTLPEGSDLARLRETGRLRFVSWGRTPLGRGEATPWPEDGRSYSAFTNHVERGDPYPTLTRRAQFLIEHPWFVEAGEDLPVHKDPPTMGGRNPYVLSSGHNRWSVHAMNMANPVLLQTHRGEPHVVVNPLDAAREGITDHGYVEVANGAGSFTIRAKLSPGQRPGSVTVYAGWDGFMLRDWAVPSNVEPGLVKHLGLAGGYGHLRYAPLEWQPVPSDRPVTVTLRPAPETEAAAPSSA